LTLQFRNKQILITITGSLVAALFVYSLLSYLFIAPRITIPVSIIMSILIFGLTRYYDTLRTKGDERENGNSILERNSQNDTHAGDHKNVNGQLASGIFIIIFAILILISSVTYGQEFHIFIDWNEIGIFSIIQLAAAIMLCFFIPGYAIVLILSKKYIIDRILAVLLSYILSILITGLTAYISSLSFDNAISQSKYLFIAVYLVILASFLIYYLRDRLKFPINLQIKYSFCYHLALSKVIKYLKTHTYELFVFGSLFMLIIVSTYVLYGGTTIGDQWYHQGRALLFLSGSMKQAVLSGEDSFYPPFQSAVLAALTTLSGMPLVNSYASIAFLDAMLIFAFYYFFISWIPRSLSKAALLACSLFTLSAGFGWIQVMTLITTHSIVSQQSSLNILTSLGNLDILNLSNLVIPSSPEFSTALIYIALPAGFVLLGLVRASINTKVNLFLVTAISVLGIVSHYEFYFFIMTACILPPTFKMKGKNFLYLSFLTAILFVYVIDLTTPGKFLTSVSLLGIPLLFLVGLFVIITWMVYLTIGYLSKSFDKRSTFLNPLSNLRYRNTRFKFVRNIIIIFLVAYLYLLSFIVLEQLSSSTIKDQILELTVPWYLYPMKLGIVGFLGLAFILSYLLKKFEKEVFVFGIIIVVALIIGPYYSEIRFIKYVMVGITAVASLMVYKILSKRPSNRPIRNIVIIGIIVPLSGLSVLLFIGYNSLILQTQDYIETLPRRHFPTDSEIGLFEALHNMVKVDSSKHNVVSFPGQYHLWKDGIMSKVPSFAGIPYDKVRQSPLVLNSSTIDALYRQLDYTGARYIIIPKNNTQSENSLTQPTRFAMEYFKNSYEDNNFIILKVPDIQAPNASKSDFAVVYNEGQDLPLLGNSSETVLPYNNNTFDFNIKDATAAIQKDNQGDDIILFDSKKGNETTLWSKTISPQTAVNSIEARFRTPGDGNKSNDNIGLKWREGNIQYYTKIYESGLGLYQKMIQDPQYKILSRNSEIKKEDWMWYTLRIESTGNLNKIYVNNVLKIQAPKVISGNNQGISKIGLVSTNDKAEFKPLKIWSGSNLSEEAYDKIKYFNYYYPASILALSNSSYDVFRDSDTTVFSKDVILVSDALKIDNYTLGKYLEHLRSGGKIVAINSDNNFNGTFSRLFSIRSDKGNTESFNNIGGNNSVNSINVPGLVKKIDMDPNVSQIAWYRNGNNQSVAPFAIEKTYPNGGKILLISAEGYFNSISNSPKQYFESLSNVLGILGLDSIKKMASKSTPLPMTGYTGTMGILGKVSLNSSSLSFPDDDSYPYIFSAKSIKIYNKTNISPITFDNMLIKSLKLVGNLSAIVNMTGSLELPGMISDHDYISVMIPNDSNMTVILPPDMLSNVEMVNGNTIVTNPIRVYNDSRIEFYNIRAAPPLKSPTILLKSPEMTVNGHVNFTNAYFDGYLLERGGLEKGQALSFQGTLKSKFDYVDHYNEPFFGGTKTKQITYFQSLAMDANTERHEDLLKLPGDISSLAKEKGEDIPLVKILSSRNNIITLVTLSIATTIGIWLIKSRHARVIKDN
jgi:hypothetical protein